VNIEAKRSWQDRVRWNPHQGHSKVTDGWKGSWGWGITSGLTLMPAKFHFRERIGSCHCIDPRRPATAIWNTCFLGSKEGGVGRHMANHFPQ
jgi:hypothetical protein